MNGTMKHPTSLALYSYWDRVRDGRLAPRRLEIEPACLTKILSETFILERCSTVDYPYRLAGTRICELFGREFRGRNFLDGWSRNDQSALGRQLAIVCQDGAGLVFEVAAKSSGGNTVTLEGSLLPLLHTGSSIQRLIGSVAAFDQPSWFGAEPITELALMSHRLIWPGRVDNSISGDTLRDGARPPTGEPLRPLTPVLSSLSGARLVKIDRRSFRVLDGGLNGRPSKD
jgi:hypothetical protein